MTLQTLDAKAAASLAKWHDMVARRDLSALDSIVHPDAMFRSPMAFKPYQSAAAVTLILRTVMNVFEDFTYHRHSCRRRGERNAGIQRTRWGAQLEGALISSRSTPTA